MNTDPISVAVVEAIGTTGRAFKELLSLPGYLFIGQSNSPYVQTSYKFLSLAGL